MTVPKVKFFLNDLKKRNINDIKYRKTLISVFVNKIYLYDDRITIIFNLSEQPLTVTDLLLSEIEKKHKQNEFCLCSELVEARGIEPLSENHLPKLSTSVSNYLIFPLLTANWKAERIGSLSVMIKLKASLDSRAPLIDISIQVVVLPNETAALIRLRTQLVCCRLILKIRRF